MPLCPVALHSMTMMTVMIMISTTMMMTILTMMTMMMIILRMKIRVRMNDILTRAQSPHLVRFLDKFGI